MLTPPWSGPVWIDMNHILVEQGLVPIIEKAKQDKYGKLSKIIGEKALHIAGVIVEKTYELMAINEKSMECYASDDGKGLRIEDFTWSNLGLHFETYEALKRQIQTTE
jgi:hypothetical protein